MSAFHQTPPLLSVFRVARWILHISKECLSIFGVTFDGTLRNEERATPIYLQCTYLKHSRSGKEKRTYLTLVSP